jgi:hypothetical protein
MTSHLVDDRGWLRLNKGGKREMREWLRGAKRGEWFAAIADTGQKHVVPWAPINTSKRDGVVMFEERDVALGDWRIVDAITSLLTAGATKEEIGRGEYDVRAWQLCPADVRAFEAAHGRERGGGWFALALWLSQRDEAAVEARLKAEKEKKDAQRVRKGTSANRRGRDAVGDAGGVSASGSKPAQALGRPPKQDQGSDKIDSKRRGVGDGSVETPTPGRAQRELF